MSRAPVPQAKLDQENVSRKRATRGEVEGWKYGKKRAAHFKKQSVKSDDPKPLAVDEFFSLESIDPDFDKPPEFMEDVLGHKIPHDEDY